MKINLTSLAIREMHTETTRCYVVPTKSVHIYKADNAKRRAEGQPELIIASGDAK